MTSFSDEILCMICTELWQQRDFNTLFNCVCSGKRLAPMAVMCLYRMQDEAPVRSGVDKRRKLIQGTNFMRWTCRWRTILLSSLGKTMYPYSQYIQTLNLRDLEYLLTESVLSVMSDKDSKIFFQGELETFAVAARDGHCQLDALKTTNRIGEAITEQTRRLEVLAGNVSVTTLSGWIPRLPQLTTLKLNLGQAIYGNGTLIRLHCPSFKGLHVWNWNGDKPDQALATVLNELRPQSLESFSSFNYGNFGTRSFQALGSHGETLTELQLGGLTSSNIPKLSLLRRCTNLVSVLFGHIGRYAADRNESHREALFETVAWLKECKKLQVLTCSSFFSAPALTELLSSENCIHLTSLRYEGFIWQNGPEFHNRFHRVLANQTSLQSLSLKGDMVRDALGADSLVESLSKLVNLTNLRLEMICDTLVDEDILQLVSRLPKLKVCTMGGVGLTDAIWDEFASLKSLRSLTLEGATRFTADGIFDFIEKLGPGNKGLVLLILNVDQDSDILWDVWEEKKLIQDAIYKKVKGWFDIRFEGVPELPSESDGWEEESD